MATLTPASNRAVLYVRMSTEHQKYSIEFQTAALEACGAEGGYEIVRTYADAGISGLTLSRRPGLKRLLSDVLSGAADFSTILTYDVSRWGRFQDPDESAHYEFLCREAGVRIEYCAEPFENDGSMASVLLKHMKRAMAAEFSRDLSHKITVSKRGLGSKGYWLGGNPGYGLRRRQEDTGGKRPPYLGLGERNAIKGRRIVIVAGPAAEVAHVRRVFHLFTTTKTTPNAIARRLNAEAPRSYRGELWTQVRVRRMLSNELYVGTRVVGRARVYLGQVQRRPEQDWLRVANACEPIIAGKTFNAAQRRLRRRRSYTEEELLQGLRLVLAETGRLSHNAIAREPRIASPHAYRKRFGSLSTAYALVGYIPTEAQQRYTAQIALHRVGGLRPSSSPLTDDEVLARLRRLRDQEGALSLELIEVTPGLPRVRNLLRRFGSLERTYELVGHAPTARQRERLGRDLAAISGHSARTLPPT